MAKKLYVGGLPYSTTDAELRDAFSQAGAVSSATVIMDRMSGRSKGFGFVEFANDDDAMKAIDTWNGKEFGGRTLTVNEARPMEPRAPRGGGGGYGGGGGGRGGGRW
ncbi:RNA-binding protein [Candidatus Kaiserbacteria bacterium]|nr:RNA-binding protein [Candidatus Kaiserbacteria bacterium]